jgi:N-acetylglucosaminyldiphosphoundecaprenol N-acetyl-beta-D-mannosaminyltransferase
MMGPPDTDLRPADAGHRVDVFGFRVFSDDLSVVPIAGSCATVSTISPNSYGIATKDKDFHVALQEADVLVLDGVYFGLASVFLQGRAIRANQGPQVFHHFMARLQATGGKAFFLGASPATLDKIAARAAREYPRVTVASFSPPFKPEFSDADNRQMLDRIAAFEPDILFVGMTAPKQEKWAHQHRERIAAHLAISVGAVFDWYSGSRPEIAPIWWKLKLVWLIRTIQRPELFRRNTPNYWIFFSHLLLAVLGLKRFPASRRTD